MEEGIAWGIDRGEFRVYHLIPRVIGGAISGALTGLFAFAGASTGAITGAIAGKASDSGVIRGAALGAIAGAVLSVEVLEVSRAYLSSELSAVSGSRNSSSMADFIEELLRSRFVDELFPPEISAAYHWQVAVSNLRQDDVYDVNGEITSRRLSRDSLKNLPSHEIKSTQSNCCPICLQDMVLGEIARSLPRCQHVFHLVCVDKWLSRHGSCPVCRRDV